MNEREDPLGLSHYTMMPDIHAIMQTGNLYIFAMNDPVYWVDPSGHFVVPTIPPQLVENFVQVAK